MIHSILLFLCLIFTCSVALSNVALVDEESGLSITMIGATTDSYSDGAGALAMELTVKNKEEQYYIIVVTEEGEKICDKLFSAIEGDKVKCSYDRSILKHGDNVFIITIFSVDKKKIVMRTKSHFFHAGYSVAGLDVTDPLQMILENKNLILGTAGGLGAAAGFGLVWKSLSNIRNRVDNVPPNLSAALSGKPSTTATSLPLKPADITPPYSPPDESWDFSPFSSPPTPPLAPAVVVPYEEPDDESDNAATLSPGRFFFPPNSLQSLKTRLQTRVNVPMVLKATGIVLGVVIGLAKLSAAVQSRSVDDFQDRDSSDNGNGSRDVVGSSRTSSIVASSFDDVADSFTITASQSRRDPSRSLTDIEDEPAVLGQYNQYNNLLDAREMLATAANCFSRSKRFRRR